MFTNKHCIACLIPIILLTLAGCGNQNNPSSTVGSSNQGTVNHAAVTKFIQQEHGQIQEINQGFIQESNLFKQVATKQVSYASFKSSYASVQSHIQSDINTIADATAPSGAETYKQEYVALLRGGIKVFADQEQAILPNGSVDKQKAATVQSELKDFVQKSSDVASKYGVN